MLGRRCSGGNWEEEAAVMVVVGEEVVMGEGRGGDMWEEVTRGIGGRSIVHERNGGVKMKGSFSWKWKVFTACVDRTIVDFFYFHYCNLNFLLFTSLCLIICKF